jgi:hypothetical protein
MVTLSREAASLRDGSVMTIFSESPMAKKRRAEITARTDKAESKPEQFRLRPDAEQLQDELQGRQMTPLVAGKTDVENNRSFGRQFVNPSYSELDMPATPHVPTARMLSDVEELGSRAPRSNSQPRILGGRGK